MVDGERGASDAAQPIEAARRRIDAIDDQLVALVERRVELVAEVHRHKSEQQRSARDADRERDMVARVRFKALRIGDEGVSWLMRTVVDVCLDAASSTAGLPPPRELFDITSTTPTDLAAVQRCAAALASSGFNIDAVNYVRHGDAGTMHLLLEDGDAALAALHSAGIGGVSGSRVLVFTLPNRPGTLAHYAAALAGIDVDFIYQATAKGVVIGAPDLDAVVAAIDRASRKR